MLYSRKANYQDHVNKKSRGRKTALEAMKLPEGTLFLSKGGQWLVKTSDPTTDIKEVPISMRRRWLYERFPEGSQVIAYYGNRRPGDPSCPLGREEEDYRTVRHGIMTHYRQPTIGVGETFVKNGSEWLLISKTGYRGDAEYASSTTLLAIKVSY